MGIVIVCRLSNRLMAERDGENGSGRGELTWRLCTLCGVGGILCGGASFFFRLNGKMMLAVVSVYLVLQMLNRLIFMVFLYRSRGALQGH